MSHALRRLRLWSYTTVRNRCCVVDQRTWHQLIRPCYPKELKVCSATLRFIAVMVGFLLYDIMILNSWHLTRTNMVYWSRGFQPEPKTIKIESYDNSDSSSFYYLLHSSPHTQILFTMPATSTGKRTYAAVAKAAVATPYAFYAVVTVLYSIFYIYSVVLVVALPSPKLSSRLTWSMMRQWKGIYWLPLCQLTHLTLCTKYSISYSSDEEMKSVNSAKRYFLVWGALELLT